MRNAKLLWGVAAAVLAVAATTAGLTSAAAAGPARHRTLTSTAQVVVRPVSWSAKVTAGYRVTRENNSSIDCTFPSSSPAAVDSDILACSPDSEYAVACWLSRTPHRTLCLRDPRAKHLFSIKRSGAMAQTLPYRVPGPLTLRLGDGTYCTIRNGGSGAELQGHPNYGAFYYCQHNQSVWAPMDAKNWGIDRAHRLWTVRTAPSSGHGSLTTRDVA